MVDLVREEKLPTTGFVRQEDCPLDDLLANRFGVPFPRRQGGGPVNAASVLAGVGLEDTFRTEGDIVCRSPIDGAVLGRLASSTDAEVDDADRRAASTFQRWRLVPAPKRGELVRLLGEELRAHKEELAALVTLETGKIISEGRGEVQEMIDVCDFAVGLSRQLYGRTIASERPGHRLTEVWQPLGPVGVITAFNFPVAVWAWNAALALVCGDPVVWKPSEKTPLCALACQRLLDGALRRFDPEDWTGLSTVVLGAHAVGERLVDDPPRRPRLGHRLHGHGPRGRRAGRQALRPVAARAGGQQRRHRLPVGRSRPHRAGHRVRRRRDRRAALHHPAPPDRPRVDPRRRSSPPCARPTSR